MQKALADGKSPQWALMMWRNTPSEGMNVSPAQKMFGRVCRTFLPTSRFTLLPAYPSTVPELLARQKVRQASYYDRKAKPLTPLIPGQSVAMRLPGQQTWSPGVCIRSAGPRSYCVRVDGVVFRRNRRQLLSTNVPPPPAPVSVEPSPGSDDAGAEAAVPPHHALRTPPRQPGLEAVTPPQSLSGAPRTPLQPHPSGAGIGSPLPDERADSGGTGPSPCIIPPRRSVRISRPPRYLADYVPR